jgi:hypothetical protein
MSQLKYWNGTAWETAVVGAQGPTGDTGATGPSGVIAVTAPITNSGTSTSADIGIDQTALVIAKTQVSGTAVVVADLASASVNFASTAGTAIFATNAGTASYSVTSGTAVYATNAGTAVYANTAGTAAPSAHASTHASDGSDAVTLAQSQVTDLETDLAAKLSSETQLQALHQTTSIVETMPRTSATIGGFGISVALGVQFFQFFTPIKTTTVSQMTMISGTTTSLSLTVARMGLYTFDGTEATLVAQTANDTTLFAATNTAYTRSFDTAGGFPATYTLVAGQRYAAAIIQTGTRSGTLLGLFCTPFLLDQVPRVTAAAASQTDLVATRNTFTSLGVLLWTRFS